MHSIANRLWLTISDMSTSSLNIMHATRRLSYVAAELAMACIRKRVAMDAPGAANTVADQIRRGFISEPCIGGLGLGVEDRVSWREPGFRHTMEIASMGQD